MLKLNASFSKKVPTEIEFSSKSYHAAVEVELPDGLTQEQLQSKIHETFKLVENSVEAEINGTLPANQNKQPAGNKSSSPDSRKASPKQLKYLSDLALQKNVNLSVCIRDYGHTELEQLRFSECSLLINKIRNIKAA